MCHFGPFRDIFGGNSFSEISDDFYALKLLFLPFFDQTIRNSQKMSIAVFQLFERNHYGTTIFESHLAPIYKLKGPN